MKTLILFTFFLIPTFAQEVPSDYLYDLSANEEGRKNSYELYLFSQGEEKNCSYDPNNEVMQLLQQAMKTSIVKLPKTYDIIIPKIFNLRLENPKKNVSCKHLRASSYECSTTFVSSSNSQESIITLKLPHFSKCLKEIVNILKKTKKRQFERNRKKQ